MRNFNFISFKKSSINNVPPYKNLIFLPFSWSLYIKLSHTAYVFSAASLSVVLRAIELVLTIERAWHTFPLQPLGICSSMVLVKRYITYKLSTCMNKVDIICFPWMLSSKSMFLSIVFFSSEWSLVNFLDEKKSSELFFFFFLRWGGEI